MADQRIDNVVGNNHGISKAGKPYVPLIEKLSKKYGIPEVLISHQMKQESSFNPAAISHKGAIGIMQILPTTAAVIGKRHNLPVEPLTDPRVNAELGTAYMRELFDYAYKNLTKDPKEAYSLAAIGYFAGPARMSAIVNGAQKTEAERAYVGGSVDYPRGIIWDYDKTESWDQIKRPGAVRGKGGFPWLLALIPVGYYYYQKKK